jgi:hypothetical protein
MLDPCAKGNRQQICVDVSPKKLGGTALPSHLEKWIANVVQTLREKKIPVYREEVIQWAEDAIV